MPVSCPASPAPIASSESPPRTSRQRRRRSFSSTVLHPHYPREYRQHPRRPPMVQASGSVVCLPLACLSPATKLPDLLAHRASLGWFEVRECATYEGKEGNEGVGVEAGEPAVEGPPESGPLQQHQPTTPQHTLDPCGRLGSGNSRRERQPCEPV